MRKINEESVQIQSLKPKSDLNTRIWDKDNGYKLYPHIGHKLLAIAEFFKKYVSLDDFGLEHLFADKQTDIIFTGSLANYNWSEFSDIDVHIVVDLSDLTELELSLLKAYMKERKDAFATMHKIKIFEYDVELYVQVEGEPLIATGIYSILRDKWVSFPEKQPRDVNWEDVEKLCEDYKRQIDSIAMSVNFGSINNHDALIDRLNCVWKKIKKGRKVALAEFGEYAIENLVFKAMRRNGYIDKILKLRSKIIDDKLSLSTK